MKKTLYVGLDVHAGTIAVAVAEGGGAAEKSAAWGSSRIDGKRYASR
ncbi:MAG: hypothetical protein ACK6DX_01480 [Acidobacteriota bacterium]|jgi:hypothetical protein